MMRRTSLWAFLLAPAFLLTGCSGVSSEFCDTLTEGGTGARIFTPYIAWGSGPGEVDSRLAAMDGIEEVPAEVSKEWDTWRAHLSAVSEAEQAGDAPSELIADGSSGQAADAGSALSDFYTGTCL